MTLWLPEYENNMELLCNQKHFFCYYYDRKELHLLKYIESSKREYNEYQINKNCIFFVLKGTISISFEKNVNKLVEENNMFLLPAGAKITTKTIEEKTTLLLLYLSPSFSFYDYFLLGIFSAELKKRREDYNIHLLEINKYIKEYLLSFLPCWNDGLQCCFFYELKIKELLFLLHSYTPEEDLISFFTPVLNTDMAFYVLIQEKYKSAKTTKELARLTNYSINGFEKRFKKVFGMSSHKWGKRQLANELYHEICCSKKTFMEISYVFNFSSSAHLSNFCKSVFGLTPKAIRNGNNASV